MTPRKTYLQGWTLYPVEAFTHHVQGAAAGLLAATGQPGMIALASIWTALYLAYQALTYLRKSDSPGLDVTDYMMGFGIAGAISVAVGT